MLVLSLIALAPVDFSVSRYAKSGLCVNTGLPKHLKLDTTQDDGGKHAEGGHTATGTLRPVHSCNLISTIQ